MSLVPKLLEGDRRALARLISSIEDDEPTAREELAELYPHTGRAHVVGVTGAPGTGKSTLVNVLAKAIRTRGQTVGIVAVDPTSPFTGGALLGDRVRMRDLAGDPGIFIRSMATRGSLGGLALATSDVVKVLDAGGFDSVLVETVGVGQALRLRHQVQALSRVVAPFGQSKSLQDVEHLGDCRAATVYSDHFDTFAAILHSQGLPHENLIIGQILL